MLRLCIAVALVRTTLAVVDPYIGFPEAWDGDKYQGTFCPSKFIPEWLDGYLVVQSCAAYGKQSDPLGYKAMHSFDAPGAVSAIEISEGLVKFSARYYPAKPYKIWNFYDRNMTKSTVPTFHSQYSPYSKAAAEMWEPVLKNDDSFPVHPNVDFWKIGNTVLGATEFAGVGMQFDVQTLTSFKGYPFKETSDFFRYAGPIYPMGMPVHERNEKDGTIYAVISGMDPAKSRMYQTVFKVTPDGTRTVEGTFEHEAFDLQKCSPTGEYTGDKKALAGYMHSITSTKNYIIVPETSYIYNPCKLDPMLSKLNISTDLSNGTKQNVNAAEFASTVPLRIHVFDKNTKKFITEKPIEVMPAIFITHQFNAYENDDGTLVADMNGLAAGYEVLSVEKMMKGLPEGRLLRFKIDLKTKTIQVSNIIQDRPMVSAEFPNYNRNLMQEKYKYGYVLTDSFTTKNKIVKIDMDAQKVIAEFSPKGSRADSTVFREPFIVPKPGSTVEDDGVVLSIGGDVKTNTTVLYVLNAATMEEIGSAEIPTFIPFGFHNRFYSKLDLGLPAGLFGKIPSN